MYDVKVDLFFYYLVAIELEETILLLFLLLSTLFVSYCVVIINLTLFRH